MATDSSPVAAHDRRNKLQERIIAASGPLYLAGADGVSAKEIWWQIRAYLINASDARFIRESTSTVIEYVKRAQVSRNQHDIGVGAERNFNRDPNLPHFTRSVDGGWFDFQLLVEQTGNTSKILAYDFEIRTPEVPTQFIRYDLNPIDSKTSREGLRSHMHPSTDDDGLSVPAPVMTPIELLDLFVHGIIKNGRVRSPPPSIAPPASPAPPMSPPARSGQSNHEPDKK